VVVMGSESEEVSFALTSSFGRTYGRSSLPAMSSMVKKPLPVLLEQLTELDDVRVIDLGEGPELVLEAEQRIAAHLADRLERQPSLARVIDDLIHGAHAAAT